MLELWEKGLKQPLAYRALTLLAAALPDKSFKQLAALPIGKRNIQLMELRQHLFGSELASIVNCTACDEMLELNITLNDLLQELVTDVPVTNLHKHIKDYEVSFRLPNSLDLLNLPSEDLSLGQHHLLKRCVIQAKHKDKEVTAANLPNEVVEALGHSMSEADPQALIQINMSCPNCQHNWITSLDIASYLWTEIEQWAKRLLQEVHRLASVYHWSEADIVNMSPWRRQAYLELIST